MGADRQWADVFLHSPRGQLHVVVLKDAGEDLTDVQQDCKRWCIRGGVPHTTARTMAEILAVFGHWGCLRDGAA